MNYSKRVELFKKVRAEYTGFLTSVLWRLTGDREIFAEALQYALLGMWRHVHKLGGDKAASYVYRIALTANSKAWRNRVGKDKQIANMREESQQPEDEKASDNELFGLIRRSVTKLPPKQARAVVMRYLEQEDYKTVAERLSCSEAGARSHVSKAISALRTMMVNISEEKK